MRAVEIRNLTFAYDGAPVLREAELTLEENRFLAIIGPNGGGKSTLLKLMLGLHKPGTGTVEVLGKAPKAARREIGYVPQDTSINRDFPISVQDVAMMGRIGAGKRNWFFNREDRSIVQEYLECLKVWQYRDQRIGSLSGGERQRVMIARALASKPRLLLLDEPTASIDATGEKELYSLLRGLRKEVTIIVVSHDLVAVSQHVDAIACVNRCIHVHEGNRLNLDLLSKVYGTHLDIMLHEPSDAEPKVRVLGPHDHGEHHHGGQPH